jgi:hypothetical protein
VRLRAAGLEDTELVAGILDECTMRYFDRPSTTEDAIGRLRQSPGEG